MPARSIFLSNSSIFSLKSLVRSSLLVFVYSIMLLWSVMINIMFTNGKWRVSHQKHITIRLFDFVVVSNVFNQSIYGVVIICVNYFEQQRLVSSMTAFNINKKKQKLSININYNTLWTVFPVHFYFVCEIMWNLNIILTQKFIWKT